LAPAAAVKMQDEIEHWINKTDRLEI
jgi:hypothetical protein